MPNPAGARDLPSTGPVVVARPGHLVAVENAVGEVLSTGEQPELLHFRAPTAVDRDVAAWHLGDDQDVLEVEALEEVQDIAQGLNVVLLALSLELDQFSLVLGATRRHGSAPGGTSRRRERRGRELPGTAAR